MTMTNPLNLNTQCCSAALNSAEMNAAIAKMLPKAIRYS